MRIVSRKINNRGPQKFKRMVKTTLNCEKGSPIPTLNEFPDLYENFQANSSRIATLSSSKRPNLPNSNFVSVTAPFEDWKENSNSRGRTMHFLSRLRVKSEPKDQEITQLSEFHPTKRQKHKTLFSEERKTDDENEAENKDTRENSTLTFKDLQYNLWIFKILTVLKIMPAELDVDSGLFRLKREKSKPKRFKRLDQFLFGFWQIYAIFRFSHLIYVTIPVISQIQDLMKPANPNSTSQRSTLETLRMLCVPVGPVATFVVYFGYIQTMTFHLSTLVSMANSAIQNLQKAQNELEAGIFQMSNSSPSRFRFWKRGKAFVKSVFQRPLRLNILTYFPIFIYSYILLVPGILFLDPNFPILMVAFCLGENFTGIWRFLCPLFLFSDLVFYLFYISLLYIAAFFMIFFMIILEQEMETAFKNLSLRGGLERGRKCLQAIKLQLILFNQIQSTIVYVAKLLTLIGSIVGGVGVIKFFHSDPLLAFMAALIHVEAASVYFILFDKVFQLTDKVEELKQKMMEKAGHAKQNRKTWDEYKRVCRSVQSLGIEAGGFYVMERESTLLFMDYVINQIVSLVLTFP